MSPSCNIKRCSELNLFRTVERSYTAVFYFCHSDCSLPDSRAYTRQKYIKGWILARYGTKTDSDISLILPKNFAGVRNYFIIWSNFRPSSPLSHETEQNILICIRTLGAPIILYVLSKFCAVPSNHLCEPFAHCPPLLNNGPVKFVESSITQTPVTDFAQIWYVMHYVSAQPAS